MAQREDVFVEIVQFHLQRWLTLGCQYAANFVCGLRGLLRILWILIIIYLLANFISFIFFSACQPNVNLLATLHRLLKGWHLTLAFLLVERLIIVVERIDVQMFVAIMKNWIPLQIQVERLVVQMIWHLEQSVIVPVFAIIIVLTAERLLRFHYVYFLPCLSLLIVSLSKAQACSSLHRGTTPSFVRTFCTIHMRVPIFPKWWNRLMTLLLLFSERLNRRDLCHAIFAFIFKLRFFEITHNIALRFDEHFVSHKYEVP